VSKPLAFSSLKAMSPKRREERLAQVVANAQRAPNGEIRAIVARLDEYEREFGLTSDEMRARVASGELAESDDICSWLMLLDLQARVVARSR
jgi:hypothetical protein